MKIQASLEFVLITSAIAVISLSAITLYGKDMAVQRTLVGAITNITPPNYGPPQPAGAAADPQIAIYVPPNSTTYSGSNLQVTAYGCAYGAANVTLSSSSVFFSNNRTSARVLGAAVLSMPFEPLLQGPNTIDIRYDFSCGNVTKSGSESLSTYARSYPSNASAASYSAYISNRSEEISYALGPPSQVINLTERGYCTQSNFWGSPLPISEQCGTSAWGYMVFSDYCYYTKAVSVTSTQCITPVATGYSTVGVSDSAAYSYGFSLAISSPFGVMRAVVGGNGEAALKLDNETVGRVSVAGVSGQGQAQGVTLISGGDGYSVADPAAMAQYIQARNSLYGTLDYYNSTSVDDSTQSSIEQSVSAFVGASKNLRGGNPVAAACTVSGGAYVCGASTPFTYVIDVNVSQDLLGANQTLYYLGSEINLFRG